MKPQTRYARSGDVPHRLPGRSGRWPASISFSCRASSRISRSGWEEPDAARFYQRLTSTFACDHGSTSGGPDLRCVPPANARGANGRCRAVMDAAGMSARRCSACSEGGPMTLLFAATYPGTGFCVDPLRLGCEVSSRPRTTRGGTVEEWARHPSHRNQRWGQGDNLMSSRRARRRAPSARGGALPALGASPGGGDRPLRMNWRSTYGRCCRVRVPTLVLHGPGDRIAVGTAASSRSRFRARSTSSFPATTHRSSATRTQSRRDRGVRDRRATRGRAGPSARDRALHRHRRLDRTGRGARRPALA